VKVNAERSWINEEFWMAFKFFEGDFLTDLFGEEMVKKRIKTDRKTRNEEKKPMIVQEK
jgi:hypothetical protein